jgi:two-component system response regulator AtoC
VKPKPSVLIVDDEKHTRDGLRRALEEKFSVQTAANGVAALEKLESEPFDVLLTDLKMPAMDGLKLLQRAASLPHKPISIVMTAYGSIENAVEAMQKGAYHYLTKPINLDELELILERALKTRRVEAENIALRQQLDEKFGIEGIIGESAAMKEVLETVKMVAPTRATVLLEGETGTGKELMAHAIHNLSPRKDAAFVAVHCAALTPTLLESELFGHEKGAFTDAKEMRIGRFEAADGGTIFLDEIGEIDPTIQVKILRVLGERAFERVGSSKTITVDVRVVAATNKNLEERVKEGKFRDDLYYRLNVVKIKLPPLRDRRDDIPLLVKRFLAECSAENQKNVREITPEAMNVLMAYDWPGNVRELRTAVEHAVVLCRDDKITLREIPHTVRGNADVTKLSVVRPHMTVNEAEKLLILQALKETGGNRTKAAEKIGLSRRTLHRKIKAYGLAPNPERSGRGLENI